MPARHKCIQTIDINALHRSIVRIQLLCGLDQPFIQGPQGDIGQGGRGQQMYIHDPNAQAHQLPFFNEVEDFSGTIERFFRPPAGRDVLHFPGQSGLSIRL